MKTQLHCAMGSEAKANTAFETSRFNHSFMSQWADKRERRLFAAEVVQADFLE